MTCCLSVVIAEDKTRHDLPPHAFEVRSGSERSRCGSTRPRIETYAVIELGGALNALAMELKAVPPYRTLTQLDHRNDVD